MNDDMYRQVLQKFREGEKDDTVFTKEERDVMNDDAFRKALRSFKKNDSEWVSSIIIVRNKIDRK